MSCLDGNGSGAQAQNRGWTRQLKTLNRWDEHEANKNKGPTTALSSLEHWWSTEKGAGTIDKLNEVGKRDQQDRPSVKQIKDGVPMT